METGRRPLVPHVVVASLLALYVGFGLHDLGRAPKVYEDEAVIAAPGYTFVTTGVFGTPLAPGFFGAERHCYELMPLFSIFVGGSMRLFGPGLFAARLAALGVAAGVLLLTHLVASRLLTAFHGAVAIALLVLAPTMSPVDHLRTGIPMVDLARLARYDTAVALFGLAALLVLAPILGRGAPPGAGRLFAAGMLTGAATLSHLYGAFWLPALLLAILATRGQLVFRRALFFSGAGFLLALLPWFLFVVSGWSDFLGQTLHYNERFDLLDARFYLSNLRGEVARYGLILGAATRHLAPGLFAVSGVAGGILLVRRARSGDAPSRALLAIPGLLAFLFALFLQSKNVLYLATLWPLFALVASLGLQAFWGQGRLARTVLVATGLVVAGEGILSLRRFSLEAAATTPYSDFVSRLSPLVPRGVRVMGMQHWWLGLVRTSPDYVTVPLQRSLRRFTPEPVRFEEAADTLAPGVLLLDDILRGFLRANVPVDARFHDLAAAMQDWLSTRGQKVGVVEDPTYGRVEVYVIRPGVLSK